MSENDMCVFSSRHNNFHMEHLLEAFKEPEFYISRLRGGGFFFLKKKITHASLHII